LKLFQNLLVIILLTFCVNVLISSEDSTDTKAGEGLKQLVSLHLNENISENESAFANGSDYKSELNIVIDSVLKKYNLSFSKYSLSLYSLNSNSYIFEKNTNQYLKPASVTKLLTSFAILETLGDTFHLRTEIYTEDSDLSDGIINGNVFIKGAGDPKITLSDLDNLVQRLQSLGIKKIEGKIIADANLYDNNRNRFAYSGDKDEVEPVAPISALSLEKNRIRVFINTSVRNETPKIQVLPSSDHFIISNNIKLVASVPKSKKKAGVRFSSHSKLNESGNQVIYLNGNLKKNSSYGVEDFNLNPELTFAYALRNRLLSNGIKVIGQIETVKRKVNLNYSNLHIITEISRPIGDVISEMNKNSDNYLAENLFKLAGAHYNADSVTSNSSKKLIDTLLRKFAGNSDDMSKTISEFKVNDGSGLSRRNMFSSKLICEMLKEMSSKPYFSTFLKSLSVCGFDGTLAKRLKGTNAQMNLMAKTGTHKDVSGLAGFVRDLDSNVYIFAFLFNGPAVGTYKMIENDLGKAISDFTSKGKNKLQVNQ
jgi:PBP4 family serine-type D-alanyl-D-alanine carboxypeptidase